MSHIVLSSGDSEEIAIEKQNLMAFLNVLSICWGEHCRHMQVRTLERVRGMFLASMMRHAISNHPFWTTEG